MKISKTLATSLSLLAAILLAAVLSSTVIAQSATGTISGTVKDSAGAAIGGAAVSLVRAHAILRSTVTDSDGKFSFDTVAPGSYAVVITRSGFGSFSNAVQVSPGNTKEVNANLEVNSLSEQVVVTAEAGQVSNARTLAQPVNIIDEQEILERGTEVVAQVVDEEPGVNLQRTSPSLSGVFVRGLTGRNVAVYVDGVRYTTSAQRGGVGTFFSLIEPSSLETVEILRGPNSSQYGSDAHGGVINFISHSPVYGGEDGEFHGNTNTFYSSLANSFGASQLVTYGTKRYGLLLNVNGRRINRARPAAGLDTHAAVTRFFGIPSDILGTRLADTAFTQYGGLLRASFNIDGDKQYRGISWGIDGPGRGLTLRYRYKF